MNKQIQDLIAKIKDNATIRATDNRWVLMSRLEEVAKLTVELEATILNLPEYKIGVDHRYAIGSFVTACFGYRQLFQIVDVMYDTGPDYWRYGVYVFGSHSYARFHEPYLTPIEVPTKWLGA